MRPLLHEDNDRITLTQHCDLSGGLRSGKQGAQPALSEVTLVLVALGDAARSRTWLIVLLSPAASNLNLWG